MSDLNNFTNYVSGKTILFLGPGKNVDNDMLSDAKQYDLLVSINNSYELYDLKFDIFYLDKAHFRKSNLANRITQKGNEGCYVISSLNYSDAFENSIQMEDPDVTTKKLNPDMAPINTGYAALIHLLKHDIKSIAFTGMDFHRSAYDENYSVFTWKGHVNLKTTEDVSDAFLTHSPSENGHQPDQQYLHFKNNLYMKDNRIIVDKYMERYLADSKYDIIYGD